MSFYGAMKIRHVKASTEEKLEAEIRKLEALHDGMLKAITMYRSGSQVVFWYYHDYQKAGAPRIGEKLTAEDAAKIGKKVTKKNTRRKSKAAK